MSRIAPRASSPRTGPPAAVPLPRERPATEDRLASEDEDGPSAEDRLARRWTPVPRRAVHVARRPKALVPLICAVLLLAAGGVAFTPLLPVAALAVVFTGVLGWQWRRRRARARALNATAELMPGRHARAED